MDAAEIIWSQVKSICSIDGRWLPDPMKLGKEVLIGAGDVDFEKVFAILRNFGYAGAGTNEREAQGPQQIADVREEKHDLEGILDPFGIERSRQIQNVTA